MDKLQLRKQISGQRGSLSDSAITRASQKICKLLLPVIETVSIQSLHYYEPILSKREPNITPVIQAIRGQIPGIVLHTTRKDNDHWLTVTAAGKIVMSIPDYDVVLVPMLGFDSQLHRLGYGGGFYDRFLADQPNAYKIGICLEAGKLARLPHGAHDIPMDVIVTEQQVYDARAHNASP